MKITDIRKATMLAILGIVLVVLSGCDTLFGPEEEEDDASTNVPTEKAIGFYDGSISGSAGEGQWIDLVTLTAGVRYRVEWSGLSENVTVVVREGTRSNIGVTVVGSSENNGSSSTSVTFTATRSSYVGGIQLEAAGSTSYSLTTYELP